MPKPLIQTTGRRKEAVARVRLRPGTGVIMCNKRPFENFTRAETFGWPDSHWLRVDVDPANPELFTCTAQIVPGNRLHHM